jgi:ribonuclease D
VTSQLVLDRQPDFEELVDRLVAAGRYAIDTEFHRERTYFPQLALMQFATVDELVLVDPLALDLAPLVRLFDSDALAVFHAAQQDLDVLTHAISQVPRRMVDTQLAAGFLGYSTPSLVSLLQGELRVTAAKGDRLTDWLRRPLSEEQCSYAAGDVAHLLALADTLHDQLRELGRLTWAEAAYEELRTRPAGAADPDKAWLKLKDVRILKAKARGVACAVAAWRERRAMRLDIPVRQVLPDLAILGIAQRQPRTVRDLGQARGVDERFTKGSIAAELLEAVEVGLTLEVQLPTADGDDLDRSMRPAVTLVSAWISDLARRQRVDTSLLATRNDLAAILRGDADARLAHGWRAELVGDGIRSLVEGRAALTFSKGGGLRLVPVDSAVDDAAETVPEPVEGGDHVAST